MNKQNPLKRSREEEPELGIHEYDRPTEPERGVVTVNTKIQSSNKGFSLLSKLGWSEGQSLGISGDGRTEPIPFEVKLARDGLGKAKADDAVIASSVNQRRGLASELLLKETKEQKHIREAAAAKQAAVRNELSDTLRPFYCDICDKQYLNVGTYNEHVNGYAHAHKARQNEMEVNARGMVQPAEVDKRKEKERKREEKEMRRIAKANGIKLAKPTAAAATTVVPVIVAQSTAPKTSGWSTVGAPSSKGGWAPAVAVPEETPSRAGWAPATLPVPPPPAPGWAKVPAPEPPSPPKRSEPPAFRTGGFTSLDVITVPAEEPRSFVALHQQLAQKATPYQSLPPQQSFQPPSHHQPPLAFDGSPLGSGPPIRGPLPTAAGGQGTKETEWIDFNRILGVDTSYREG